MSHYLSLKDHVYRFISSKITDGALSPNEKINENIICEELNISRTPVREALIQLASEGCLDNIPRKGFRVKQIDEKKASELYLIIGNLEGLAASISCTIISDDDIDKMDKITAAMDKAILADDFGKYYSLQSDFHDIYIDICNNEELIRLLNQLKRSFMRQSYVASCNDNLRDVLLTTNNEHKRIVEIFRERSSVDLEAYLRNVHWSSHNAKFDSL